MNTGPVCRTVCLFTPQLMLTKLFWSSVCEQLFYMLNWTRILPLQFRSSNQYATELREYIAINSIITSWYWPDQTVLITRTFYIVLDGHNRRLAVENSRRPIVPTLWRRQWNFSTFEVILQLQWPLDESCGVWQLHLYEAPRQFHLIITFMGFAKYLRD